MLTTKLFVHYHDLNDFHQNLNFYNGNKEKVFIFNIF